MKKLLSPSIIAQGKLESRSNSLRFTPFSGARARTIGFGITIGIVSMFLTFNSVHAQSLNPVTTIIPTVSAAKEARSAAREALVKTNADREIERRITALNYVTTRINEIKKLIVENDLKVQETIFVGDMVHDIDAAKAVNIKIAVVTYGYDSKTKLEKENPQFILNKFEDIKKLI